MGAALRMLARRPLSEGEIRKRLLAKGFTGARSSEVLSRLRELGLAEDRELCRRLAIAYRDVRRYGPRKIAGALKLRLFPDGLVDEVVREICAPDEEQAAAGAALRKRFREGVPPGREGAAKAFRFLSGRGFSPDACRRAIRGTSFDIAEEEEA